MYGFSQYCRRSSGLFNSTRFVVEALQSRGIVSKIVEVDDNNEIDKEVSRFRALSRFGRRERMIVIIEALWVVPEKFDVLKQLHPTVSWHIHLHSNLPFLALEGIASGWIIDYAKRGVGIIANSEESYEALRTVVPEELLAYLPNCYVAAPMNPVPAGRVPCEINIGCFGAVRPFKNHLIQAMAAIRFAAETGKRLRFHVNATRIETGGSPVLKNLVELFDRTPNAELVLTDWMEPDAFVRRLHHTLDLGMQCSLTETFNIVSADYVTAGVPIVVSPEVRWVSSWSQANPHDINDIVRVMHRAYGNWLLVRWNQFLLGRTFSYARRMWTEWVRSF